MSLSYRPDIQGLRAIAVLAVILFHYDASLLPGGFVGVDIFLVISGYLMTNILQRKKVSDNFAFPATVKQFYIGRIKRIVPAYYAMLLLVSVLAAILFVKSDFSVYGDSLKQALYFDSNNYFAGFGDYFAPATDEQPLLHTWSLAVEMQFYLLFPFLVLQLPLIWLKRILLVVFIGMLFLSEYLLSVQGNEQSTYYALYARIPEFLAGALIALHALGDTWSRQQANWFWGCGILLILSSIALIDGPFPGLLALPAVIGAALVIAGRNSSYRRCLHMPLLVWLGALSYSLYLWHWPILALVRYYTGVHSLGLAATLLFVLFTLLLSAVSYYWIEKRYHGRRGGQEKSERLSWLRLTTGLVVIVLVVGSVKITERLNEFLSPPSLPVEYLRYADPTTICHGKVIGDCLRGDLGSSREVLVIGDSHGAMLNLFFDRLGKELGFKARIITASNCVTIPGFDYHRLAEWARKSCISQIKEVASNLDSATVIILAGMWSYQTSSKEFNMALQNFLRDWNDRGKRLYILPQVLKFNKNPLRARRLNYMGLSGYLWRDLDSLRANDELEKMADQFPLVHYIDLEGLEIFKDAPFYNHQLIYFDESHLNEIGSKVYATAAKNRFSLLTEFRSSERQLNLSSFQ